VSSAVSNQSPIPVFEVEERGRENFVVKVWGKRMAGKRGQPPAARGGSRKGSFHVGTEGELLGLSKGEEGGGIRAQTEGSGTRACCKRKGGGVKVKKIGEAQAGGRVAVYVRQRQ